MIHINTELPVLGVIRSLQHVIRNRLLFDSL